MKRAIFTALTKWKNSKNRKPLIIQGARQVGKTWLMNEFAKSSFSSIAYLNFESSERLKNIFISDFDIERIISVIEIETKVKINPKNTLLIFDEIQEAEKGLTALKYFYEKAPEFHIIAAGSLLGLSLQKNNSFPVGKVDFLELYPLSFLEFLENIGEKALAENIQAQKWNIINSFHLKIVQFLRLYYFIGGMPEVVYSYIQDKDLEAVRALQKKILLGYENDFAKHAPLEIVPRIKQVFNSVLGQISKENKKFIYGQIKKGARAKDFEKAINWLIDAGLILKVNRINKPNIPLSSYADLDAFKLFLVDIGLLNAMANIDQTILLEKNDLLKEFKGALTEQYVCQQLKLNNQLFYWSAPNGTAEIDFLIQDKNEVIPIEVKAEENLKSKSLKVFADKYKPKKALRVSMSPYRDDEWLINIPLYAAGYIAEN